MTVVYTHHKNGECLLRTVEIIFKRKSLDHFVNGHLVANISCIPLGDECHLVKLLSNNILFHKKFCFFLRKEHFLPQLAHLKTALKSLYIHGVIISHPWGPHTNLMEEQTVRTLADVLSISGKT